MSGEEISLKEIERPEWVEHYCVGRESVSDCVEKWKYTFRKEYGYIYSCKPFPGIHLWANDVYMKCIPISPSEEYHFIKLNYCMEGRCEVRLEDDRYVYLEKGVLSIDTNQPKENFIYPSGRYEGLELIFDLHSLGEQKPQALYDFGFSPEKLAGEVGKSRGSYIGTVSGQWKETAERLTERLKSGKGRIEDFRFDTLQLLYLLGKGTMLSAGRKVYLTKGQRMIAAGAEEKICGDLKHRYTVEELAGEYGVSPSSLKKYFEQMYGTPISEYLRQKRMAYACELLAHSHLSVADIAAEAGYSNQGKFCGAFKKYTRKSPLEYRRLQCVSQEKQGTKERRESNVKIIGSALGDEGTDPVP